MTTAVVLVMLELHASTAVECSANVALTGACCY
jgi:hypothetical protein